MKKNMKAFAVIAGLFLLFFCAAMLILTLLGVFSKNDAGDPLSGGHNILTELITPKYEDPSLLWQDEPKGEKFRVETDAGSFTVTLYASDAANAFKTFAGSGAFAGKSFATVTDSFALSMEQKPVIAVAIAAVNISFFIVFSPCAREAVFYTSLALLMSQSR